MVESLYIHIPFCRKKCFYCDFYSVNYKENLASVYIETLCKQIDKLEDDFSTIYIGGGTPTVLGAPHLGKLLKSLKRVSKKVIEFTVEANPESLDEANIELFLAEGVNRLSIGAQSVNEGKLKKLGRIHSVKQAQEAVFLAKKKGFKNISIDLIFGLWNEDLAGWQEELSWAVKLPVTHISAYMLTYKKNTFFFKEVKAGRISPLEDDIVAQMYEFAMDYLPKQGFFQYEVSNFSKKGYVCRHNLNYWENNSYLGLGASAVSYVGGVREKSTSNVKDYIERLKKGKTPVVFREKLTALERAKETAALLIRTKGGIDFRKFKEKYGFDFLELKKDAIGELIKSGKARQNQNKGEPVGVYLTKKGFLFCDTASAAFL